MAAVTGCYPTTSRPGETPPLRSTTPLGRQRVQRAQPGEPRDAIADPPRGAPPLRTRRRRRRRHLPQQPPLPLATGGPSRRPPFYQNGAAARHSGRRRGAGGRRRPPPSPAALTAHVKRPPKRRPRPPRPRPPARPLPVGRPRPRPRGRARTPPGLPGSHPSLGEAAGSDRRAGHMTALGGGAARLPCQMHCGSPAPCRRPYSLGGQGDYRSQNPPRQEAAGSERAQAA